MKLTAKSPGTIVGLDIEAGSVAAAEIRSNGSSRLGRTGIASLPPGVTREGEVSDPEALSGILKQLFDQHKLPKQVRVGVANQRVVVRTLRLPLIEEPKELESAVRFQAADHVPMPLEQAIVDWQVVAKGVGEDRRQMDVSVVAARTDMVSSLAQTLSSAGLRPVGIDVSAFAMIRALHRDSEQYEQRLAGNPEASGAGLREDEIHRPARLYCNLGDVTNLAVALGSSCLFTRVAAFGVEGIAQRLAERRGLTLEHARQWLNHVGLEQPTEAIEGDPEVVSATREILSEGASKLADELRLSLDFYGAQEGALAVEEIVACGPGTTIEGLGVRLERELGRSFRIARPEGLAQLGEAAAARLTLSYGLGLES